MAGEGHRELVMHQGPHWHGSSSSVQRCASNTGAWISPHHISALALLAITPLLVLVCPPPNPSPPEGSHSLYGYFNTITDAAAFQPVAMTRPRLPASNYTMDLRLAQPCTMPGQPAVDRCQAAPPPGVQQQHGNASSADLPGVVLLHGQRYMAR